MSSLKRFVLGLLATVSVFSGARAGELTLNIGEGGAAVAPPTTLVNLGDSWRYRFGTNAPQAGWKTVSEATLDATWQTGPAGFGYEDGDDATLLTTMSNRFTTVYIRKTFTVPAGIDASQRLQLVVDFDDAFIAWLDGVEIARASNAPGAVGTEPAFSAVSLAPNHEARGYQGLPLEVFDGGVVGSRLAPGTHVLSVLGLNSGTTSSDFTLNPSLRVTGGTNPGNPLVDGFFRLVTTNLVVLSGSNSVVGAARVVVNGDEANFNIAEGTWFKAQTLKPGMNKIYVAALDSTGAVLASATKDVVYQQSSTTVGGTLSSDTVWTSDMGIIRVTNDVIVPTGRTLTISNGAIVLFPQTNSIKAQPGAAIVASGTADSLVYFLPADGTNAWRELSATGTNSTLTLRHAMVVAGQSRALNGGVVLIEDSRLQDLHAGGREIVAGVDGGDITVRRSYIARFAEVDARETPVLIEDCLLEQFLVDGVDIKGTNVPLVIRRSTLRFGDPNNSNADALDFGPGPGTVENCLIHHFPDKGVSIGGASGSTVTGSVIYQCGIGISAYASSNIFFRNTTIVGCTNGILARNNPTPAIGAATNMLIWGNINNVVITNTSMLQFSHSDTQGTNFPGVGNISADPLFVNAAAADFRLLPGSPAMGTGLGGVDMGAIYPVGGIPSEPADVAAILKSSSEVVVQWRDTADNEATFLVQSSPNGITWLQVATAEMNSTGVTLPGLSAGKLYFRVKTVNAMGESPWSNLTGVQIPGPAVPQTVVGGTLTQNSTWSPNLGTILVQSSVIVPSNIVLTIEAGTVVKMTNGTSLRATSGGIINILGTENNKVWFSHVIQSNMWGELAATGTNASITVRHADVRGGQTTVMNGASGLLEDSFFHDYRISGGTIFTSPIMLSHFAKSMVVRRCHFREYHETLLRNGVILVEQCLFEEIHGDALDFDGAWPGTILRQSTFRNGFSGNVDAVDVGNDGNNFSTGVIVEDCMMYNFPFDKGVSIGDGSENITVRNCLMYGCDSGVAVKDECTATIYNCTMVDSTYGINLKAKYPEQYLGGRATNTYNNIIWGNELSIWETNSSIISVKYSDVEGTNFPGVGNISVDPLFRNAAQRDYRLASNSPCLTSGLGGGRMGVTFPIGGLPDVPGNVDATALTGGNSSEAAVSLTWADTSSVESGFAVEATTNGVLWALVTNAPANASSAVVSGLTAGKVYAFRVRATNFIGESFNSDLASASGPAHDVDGDGLPDQYELDNAFDAYSAADAVADTDADGATNLQEYLAGTNPRSASSRLAFTAVQRLNPTQVNLAFRALANRTYSIQFRDSLSTGSWQTLANVAASSSEQEVGVLDTLPNSEATRFYRIVTP